MIKYLTRSFLYLFFFSLTLTLLSVLTIVLWPSFFDDDSIISMSFFMLIIILSIISSVILTKRISIEYLKINDDGSNSEKISSETPATMRDRVLAMIADSIIIFVLFFLIAKVVLFFNVKSELFDKVILIGIIFFYEPVMVSFFTGTFGHKFFRLKVLTLNNKKVFLPFAFIRFLIKLLLGAVSFVTMTGKNRMAFQDLVTGTKVIYY